MIEESDIDFAHLAPPTDRAAGAVFYWCVTDASYDLEPRVMKAQFGDSYAQRRPDGINTQDRVWSVQMRNQAASVADAVIAFLEARNGVDVFNWTPPRTASAEDVICPKWSLAYGDQVADGSRLMNITMTFEQVHQ
ncbi:phage tail protein [Paraburkholderia sp. MM5477-R1]|uniref:phage tail protein n=1 Tax=Paraburkholderia sp. MM5477-R1 TaxID=2991062 RepID=UPI003D1E86F8